MGLGFVALLTTLTELLQLVGVNHSPLLKSPGHDHLRPTFTPGPRHRLPSLWTGPSTPDSQRESQRLTRLLANTRGHGLQPSHLTSMDVTVACPRPVFRTAIRYRLGLKGLQVVAQGTLLSRAGETPRA